MAIADERCKGERDRQERDALQESWVWSESALSGLELSFGEAVRAEVAGGDAKDAEAP